jgi:hypothetical protein
MRRVLPVVGCALRKTFYFHEDIALSLNGVIETCTKLNDVLRPPAAEWQMVEVGEISIPSPGLGMLTKETYAGTFSHKNFQKGKTLDVSVSLLWSLGRKELFKSNWTIGGKSYPIIFEQDGSYLSFIDEANNLSMHGKWIDTGAGDADAEAIPVLKGDVERSGAAGGKFEMTMGDEQLRCTVEVMVTGNENGLQQEGMMYSSAAFSKRAGGVLLPQLQVPAQVAASYQSKAKCASKTCECNTRKPSDYGLFIDRCYAFRQSTWIPNLGDGFNQNSIRNEPSFRIPSYS